MKSHDLVELAGRNLREAVLRNSLTTAGIAVGIASLVAMLSLGAGLQRLASKQLGRSGLFDSIIVTSRADFRTQEDEREAGRIQTSQMRSLDDKARDEIRSMPHVKDVYPDIRLMAELRFDNGKGERPHFSMLAALPATARASEVFDDLQGSFFSSNTAPEALILADFARDLLDVNDKTIQRDAKLSDHQLKQVLGKQITLRYAERVSDSTGGYASGSVDAVPSLPRAESRGARDGESTPATDGTTSNFSVVRREKTFTVVGVVPSEPYGGFRGGARGRIFIPTALAEQLNMVQPTDLRTMMRPSQGKSYFTLVVQTDASSHVKQTQDAIKKMGFSTYSILDASKGLDRFFRILDMFLGVFGSLAIAVASLGIINTLVMAILERRREIGIMKAIGASDGDVQKLFFVEASSMGAFGGALGILLGWTIGRVINFGTNIYLQRNQMPPEDFWYVSPWLIGGAMLFSIIVSLIAGIYPAARAAKLDPVQALRHE
jgi:ABC-type antimicrobial peptide transport system permease subunit